MSSEKNMDELKVKDGLPSFGPDPKAAKSAAAKPKDSAQSKKADLALDAEALKAVPGGLRVIRGGGAEIVQFAQAQKSALAAQAEAIVSSSSKTEQGFDAKVGVDKDGVNASVGLSMKKTTEVKSESKAKGQFSLEDKEFIAALKAKGVDLSSGKIPLDVLAEVLAEMAGEAPNTALLDAKAHDKMLADISKRLSVGLREEKGAELRAGVTAGGGGGRVSNA